MVDDEVRDAAGAIVPLQDERAVYALAGLACIAPELREWMGELVAAGDGALPALLDVAATSAACCTAIRSTPMAASA